MEHDIGGAAYIPKPGFEFKYSSRAELEANNPAKRLDGLDDDKIGFFWRQINSFIHRMAGELKLNIFVIQTAFVYCERFYAKRSLARNDRFLVVAAALFLASKAMDGPRPVAHVAHAYFKVKNANKPEELAALARDPQRKLKEHDVVESIIIAERAILYTLAFQIKIELPQNAMFMKLKLVGVYTFSAPGPGSTPPVNLPKEKETKLSQLAVNFSNDSFKTSLPLQYDAEKLSAAALYHAARQLDIDLEKVAHLPGGKSFHEAFGITQAELEDIYDQLSPMYEKAETAKKKVAASHQAGPSGSAAADPKQQQQRQQQLQRQAAKGSSSQAIPNIVLPPPPGSSASSKQPIANGLGPKGGTASGAQQQQQQQQQQAHARQQQPHAAQQPPLQPQQQLQQQAGLEDGELPEGPSAAPHSQSLQGATAGSQQQQLQGVQHADGSRKAARTGELASQGPGVAQQQQQHAPPHAQQQGGQKAQLLPSQQHQRHAAEPVGLNGHGHPWGGSAGGDEPSGAGRKRKADELGGEPMAQGMVS